MATSALSYISLLRADPHPHPDYRVCRTPDSLHSYIGSHLSQWPILACDTESLPTSQTYCLTISHTPGTGRLIYARDNVTISWFREWLKKGGTDLLLFHNYL